MTSRRYATITCAYLAACLIFGGASAAGIIANGALQIAAIAMILIAVLRLRNLGFENSSRWPLAIMFAVLLLGPLQLLPLPPSIWTTLPGRERYVDGLAQLGIKLPWLGISLSPALTMRSTLALLPAAGAFMAVLALDLWHRSWLAWLIVGFAILSLIVGLAQIGMGPDSPLYFYEITNRGSAVGFFSNRNHLATLMLAALPMIAALLNNPTSHPSLEKPRHDRRLLAAAAMIFIVIGILATGSRAGLALLFPAALLTFALSRRTKTGMISWPIIAAATGLTLAAILIVFLGPTATRITQKSSGMIEDETRFIAAPVTARAALENLPFGTGLGTFDPIYRANAPAEYLPAAYVNHAHNDYLELLLTGGLPAMLLVALFAIWFWRTARSTWKQRAELAGTLPRAAVLAVGMVAAHSLVDYPLRTAAISALFAACCALLVMPPAALRQRRSAKTELKQAKNVRIGAIR